MENLLEGVSVCARILKLLNKDKLVRFEFGEALLIRTDHGGIVGFNDTIQQLADLLFKSTNIVAKGVFVQVFLSVELVPDIAEHAFGESDEFASGT
ncbi:MAG: hypothetical protein AAGC95_11330 [Pseudomonadota bacterium]